MVNQVLTIASAFILSGAMRELGLYCILFSREVKVDLIDCLLIQNVSLWAARQGQDHSLPVFHGTHGTRGYWIPSSWLIRLALQNQLLSSLGHEWFSRTDRWRGWMWGASDRWGQRNYMMAIQIAKAWASFLLQVFVAGLVCLSQCFELSQVSLLSKKNDWLAHGLFSPHLILYSRWHSCCCLWLVTTNSTFECGSPYFKQLLSLHRVFEVSLAFFFIEKGQPLGSYFR